MIRTVSVLSDTSSDPPEAIELLTDSGFAVILTLPSRDPSARLKQRTFGDADVFFVNWENVEVTGSKEYICASGKA